MLRHAIYARCGLYVDARFGAGRCRPGECVFAPAFSRHCAVHVRHPAAGLAGLNLGRGLCLDVQFLDAALCWAPALGPCVLGHAMSRHCAVYVSMLLAGLAGLNVGCGTCV